MLARTARIYRDAYSGLSAETWMLTAVQLINRSGTMVLPFLAVYLSQARGYSATQAGYLLAVYGVGAIVGTFAGGQFTQRVGPIRVLIAAELAAAPGFLAIPHCASTASLAAALFCLSVVNEAVRPAVATAVSLFSAAESLPRAYALNRLALNLGMTVGPTIGGFLAVVDYGLLFSVNAACALLTAAATAAFFGTGVAKVTAGADRERTGATVAPHRDGAYLAYLGLQLLAAIVFFQIVTTMPLYWKEQCRFDESRIGLLFAVNTLAIVALEMPLIKSVERRSPLRLIAVGTLLLCVGFAMTALAKTFAVAAGVVLVWTVGEMLAAPFTATFAANRAGAGNPGAHLGLLSSTFSVAFVLAPIVGTTLYEFEPDSLWLACLAMAVVLPPGFLILERRARRTPIAEA